jgi:hypothetical protein
VTLQKFIDIRAAFRKRGEIFRQTGLDAGVFYDVKQGAVRPRGFASAFKYTTVAALYA